jgi:assimilatory nitrate reductase catalytic subunit
VARHDWRIAVDFAKRLEANGVRANGVGSELINSALTPIAETPFAAKPETTLFPYQKPEDIWLEHRESTRGRDLDITGLSYATLENQGPQQWPLREGESAGRERLYEDGVFPTPDGKAHFAALPYKPLAEPRESRFPFSLTTGRLRDQWHGMSRTGTLGRLFGHVAEPAVQLNAHDMARLGLADGDLVHVTSKRGSLVLPAQASEQIAPAQAFIAMHWGSEYLSGRSSSGEPLAGVNALTTSAFCPGSRQPELKHAAVKVLKAELPWTLLALAWLPDHRALAVQTELRAWMPEFEFASCVPFGRERTGVLFRAAAHQAPAPGSIDRLEALLGLNHADTQRYVDRRLGQRRAARLLRAPGVPAGLEGFLLAGDTRAEAWLKPLLQDELPAEAYARRLLMPGARAPVDEGPRGKQICTCLNVSDTAIRDCLSRCEGSDEQRLAQLQDQLRCGTQCGSCVPELRRLVHDHTPALA